MYIHVLSTNVCICTYTSAQLFSKDNSRLLLEVFGQSTVPLSNSVIGFYPFTAEYTVQCKEASENLSLENAYTTPFPSSLPGLL